MAAMKSYNYSNIRIADWYFTCTDHALGGVDNLWSAAGAWSTPISVKEGWCWDS